MGLGAVVLATLGNTLLEWFKQSHADTRSAVALRRGILEELKHIKSTADINASRAADAGNASFLIPIQENFPMYDHGISKIGLLKPSEIGTVVAAYASLKAQTEVYCLMGIVERHESGVLIAQINGSFSSILSGQAKHLSEIVGKAILELEK